MAEEFLIEVPQCSDLLNPDRELLKLQAAMLDWASPYFFAQSVNT
jgi:hypothetical protein